MLQRSLIQQLELLAILTFTSVAAIRNRGLINLSFTVHSNSTCTGSGTVVTTTGVSSLASCQSNCVSSSTCKSFDYSSSAKTCLLLAYYAGTAPISTNRFCGVGQTSKPTRRPTKKPTRKPAQPSKKPSKRPTMKKTRKPTATTPVKYTGDPCTKDSTGKCPKCTGDCDFDSDCSGLLRCVQRHGGEDIPGCDSSSFDKSSSDDFCFLPITSSGVVNYVGECGYENYKCGRCEGDCDSDSDCQSGLICFQRSWAESVPGCSGAGGSRDVLGKDYCVDPKDLGLTFTPTAMPTTEVSELKGGPYPLSLRYHSVQSCNASSPCEQCTGWCSSDSDCSSGLSCFVRTGNQPIPGCVTGGNGDVSDQNYCYKAPQNGPVTFIPGEFTVSENGLSLSTGLTSRLIASSGNKVAYQGGGESSLPYHTRPDFGATFNITSGANAGGWIYVQNSESSPGGVGAITFNSNGNPIDYKMVLTGTSGNCGGGKTYWNTWVTCLEIGSTGQCYEVDPLGSYSQVTKLGNTGGSYESFSYDDRNRSAPTFYITNDSSNGGICRFTPSTSAVSTAKSTGVYKNLLTADGAYDWLVLNPSADQTSGTFSWSSSRATGDSNAASYYRNNEGIELTNGILSFTSKTYKWLFILDLDNLTYKRYSTVSGALNGEPDQIVRIAGSDLLWFCEDTTSHAGIHVRDKAGNFYSILDGVAYPTETTGLAFSPDNKRMYVSYQSTGELFEIKRTDGYAFNDPALNIRYN